MLMSRRFQHLSSAVIPPAFAHLEPPDVPVFPADSRKIRHFTLLGVRVVAQGSKTGTDALFCVSSIQYTSKSASTLKALEKAFIKKEYYYRVDSFEPFPLQGGSMTCWVSLLSRNDDRTLVLFSSAIAAAHYNFRDFEPPIRTVCRL